MSRQRQKIVLYWLLLMATTLSTGCTGYVRQPAVLLEPVTIYLVDHGRHSSLILPREDGLVRYAYGDWEWYVKDQRGTLAGISAMMWPTRGALGRRIFPDVEIPPIPSHVVPEGFEEIFPLQAEATSVRHLQQNLDSLFEDGRSELFHHPFYDLEFVPHPRGYWFGHQSNQVISEWLRQLGFTVSGTAWFSDWQIESTTKLNDDSTRRLSENRHFFSNRGTR